MNTAELSTQELTIQLRFALKDYAEAKELMDAAKRDADLLKAELLARWTQDGTRQHKFQEDGVLPGVTLFVKETECMKPSDEASAIATMEALGYGNVVDWQPVPSRIPEIVEALGEKAGDCFARRLNVTLVKQAIKEQPDLKDILADSMEFWSEETISYRTAKAKE